jgi:hypothetical protein
MPKAAVAPHLAIAAISACACVILAFNGAART